MKFCFLAGAMGLALFASAADAADFSMPMCPAEIAPRTSKFPRLTQSLEFVRRDREKVALPSLGSENTVEVGESMTFNLNYSVLPGAVRLKSPLSFRGLPPQTNRRGFLGFKRKHKFIVEVPAGRYELSPILNQYIDLPVYRAPLVVPLREKDGAPYPKADVGLFPVANDIEVFWALGDGVWSSGALKASFEIEYCAHWQEGDFRRELIYSGISQGTVTITYKEFKDDLARPAFSQELRYDLNQGREVGFRGARFEILEATNSMIRYRVLKPLD